MSGTGSRDGTSQRRWQRGDQMLWTYTNPTHPGLYDQRPVTVIADDEKHLAVWLESGTRMLHQVLADGSGIRTADGPARFGAPRAQGLKRWQGPGIVAVFQPGADYSVWYFATPSGRRDSFYINLEEPFTRFDRGILTSDHVLDIVVDAQGRYQLKDEDELEFARAAGMFSDEKAARIRSAADSAIEDIRAWTFPFDSDYPDFRPDPAWPMPELPAAATWDFES
ncbi:MULTISPECIES: DUF402 domain-containing protein [unclassified Brevibacterium]|uniref:DUF402 domain-containing protein n=1 Tax=unclassified Brevibacterium TaxID=2614124 RepID=UPI0010922C02|nr:DUF402 domain-containing protein [Brevibacterium sp. S22]TGD32781.1 DUF402 domain-containing protein [Brevibacterium sp. S22]